MTTMPTVPAHSSACSALKPRLPKKSCRCGTIEFHVVPCEKPSKLVVPIIVHSSATVPATGVSGGAPPSTGRVNSARSRQCSGEIRANIPK